MIKVLIIVIILVLIILMLSFFKKPPKKIHTIDVGKLDDAFVQAIKDKIAQDGDIKAIKYVREQTGLGLVEAKNIVDAIKDW